MACQQFDDLVTCCGIFVVVLLGHSLVLLLPNLGLHSQYSQHFISTLKYFLHPSFLDFHIVLWDIEVFPSLLWSLLHIWFPICPISLLQFYRSVLLQELSYLFHLVMYSRPFHVPTISSFLMLIWEWPLEIYILLQLIPYQWTSYSFSF